MSKPAIGNARQESECADIARTNRLMYLAALEWAAILAALGMLLS